MKKIEQSEFERRIKKRFPNEEFTIIDYKSIGAPVIIQCNKCKQQIKVKVANNFLAPSKAFGCKNCNGLWKDREYKINQLKQKYDIINTYVKETHTYYQIKCKQCGHIRESTLNNLYKHLECGCQTGIKRNRTAEEFILEVNENSELGTYTLINDYINQTTKVLLKHNDCGFIWEVRPSDVIHAHAQCPRCMKSYSRMVLYIQNIFEQNQIPFQMEKRLDNSLQRFDFYLEKDKLKIAIEYNGAQHYIENNYFSTTLEQQQERDKRKREYCLKNNIILYELSYLLTKQEIHDQIIQIINKFNDYPIQEQS